MGNGKLGIGNWELEIGLWGAEVDSPSLKLWRTSCLRRSTELTELFRIYRVADKVDSLVEKVDGFFTTDERRFTQMVDNVAC